MLAGTGLAAPADLSRQVATRALAAHSAGAGGGLFHIMTIKSVVGGTAAVAAAALLGLAGAGAAFYGVRSAHVADEALQRAQRGLAAQKRVLERLPAMTAGRTAEINGAQTPPAAAANDNSVREAPATLAVGSQPRGDPHRDAQIFLTQYPEAKAMLLKIAKAQIASNYSPYFAQAGLSAAQVEDFENATAQLWVDTEQLSPTTFGPSVTSLPPDQARAILGEDGYTQFQNFQANSGAMGLAAMVAARVGYTAQPLSSGQTAALEELFKNAGGASDWNAIAAQAQTILSADQWTAAEGVFADQQLAQEVAGAPKTY